LSCFVIALSFTLRQARPPAAAVRSLSVKTVNKQRGRLFDIGVKKVKGDNEIANKKTCKYAQPFRYRHASLIDRHADGALNNRPAIVSSAF
ncbi:hypothetical protein, partial [Serratia marcescens]|uniref:hypothetical protein n=1 Tax=Serratia marcescens TaxID=615 RepID=UPI0021BA7BBB